MSLSSNMLFYTMKIINGKQISAKSLYKPQRGINELSTAKFGKHFHTVTQDINGFKIITIKAKNNNCTNNHIIFLHGGAYTLEALPTHRKMIEKLCNNHHLTVSCINYPLSPEYQSEITLHILHESYKFLISKYTDDEFYLFGDSSGGGLALAFLQQLKDKSIKPFPTKTVLLSPWLDISLDNKDIPVYENKDPILSKDALMRVGKLYAGKVNVKDATVSPLFGGMDGLGNILLLFSAYELFYPDCMLLKTKLEKAKGTTIESYTFYNRIVHDWVLMPIPEANKTIRFIGDWFNK